MLKKIFILFFVLILTSSCSLFNKAEEETNVENSKNNLWKTNVNISENNQEKTNIDEELDIDINISEWDIKIGTGENDISEELDIEINNNINEIDIDLNSWNNENNEILKNSWDEALVDKTIEEIDEDIEDLFKFLDTEDE